MLHFAFLAAANAAASCGRLSRASAPFPVSNSAYSSMMVSDSAAAKRSIAALCASMPSPERCCCCVETRRYATARPIQTAYHRMPCGRRAIQSNVIAFFMLQQRRQIQSFPAALRHALTGGPTLEVPSDIVMAPPSSEAHHRPSWPNERARCGLMAFLLSPRLVPGLEAVQNYHGLAELWP